MGPPPRPMALWGRSRGFRCRFLYVVANLIWWSPAPSASSKAVQGQTALPVKDTGAKLSPNSLSCGQ